MGLLQRGVSPVLKTVDSYNGEAAVYIEATQLNVERRDATRIVREWCDFLAAGPSPIVELEFVSRTPSRLWNSLASQTQLRVLRTKWGDYSDLSVLEGMRELIELRLGGGTAVTSLAPLAALDRLGVLELEDTWRVHDYSPIGRMTGLRKLMVGPGMNGRTMRADSIGFVRTLSELQSFGWAPTVDSLDYSPLLELVWVKEIWLRGVRGMVPSMVDLEWALPGIQAVRRLNEDAADYHFVPVIEEGEFIGELRTDDRGTTMFHPLDGGEPQTLE